LRPVNLRVELPVMGGLAGLATHLRRSGDGQVLGRAGWLAAGLWITGVGARMVFVFAAGSGPAPVCDLGSAPAASGAGERRRGGAGRAAAARRQQPSIRVLIADDQRVVRDGLSMLVALIDGVQVVGAASDGGEALALALAHYPRRGPDGPAHARHGWDHRDRPTPPAGPGRSGPGADHLRRRRHHRPGAARRGTRVTKDASAEQIEAAIRAVHAGQTHLDPAVQEHLVAAVTSREPDAPEGGIGARDRAQAVRCAYRAGLASPGT
jgi:hypothetical protein